MSTLGIAYIIGGALCVAYYLLIGLFSRFGLSISWIWLALGAALVLAGLSTRWSLPQWLRWAWRGALLAGLALVCALECLVISGMSATAPAGMDYLVVLGANVYATGPSPALLHRIEAVTDCLAEHPDAMIIASGGKGEDEPISEAQCIRDELVARGVDPARILLEDRSRNTRENLANAREMIGNDAAKVAVVTNNYHVWRSLWMARQAGLKNVWGVASEYTGPTLLHFMIREAVGIAANYLKGIL